MLLLLRSMNDLCGYVPHTDIGQCPIANSTHADDRASGSDQCFVNTHYHVLQCEVLMRFDELHCGFARKTGIFPMPQPIYHGNQQFFLVVTVFKSLYVISIAINILAPFRS